MLKFAATTLALFLFQFQPTRLDTSTAITYFVEDGKGVAGYLDSDRQLAVFKEIGYGPARVEPGGLELKQQ